MDLFIIRHAEAYARGEEGIDSDAARPLTPQGRATARLLAQVFTLRELSVEAILASPLVRAQQTAEELRVVWGETVAVHTCEALAPEGRFKKILRQMRELKASSVALVGHEPDLSELVGWWIGSRKAQVNLAKAGVAYIHFANEPAKGAGTLIWLLTPEWFAGPQPLPQETQWVTQVPADANHRSADNV